MTALDDLVSANASYSDGRPAADQPAPPGRKLAVLACMDARLDLFGALGLEIGEAHLIRNAGGIATSDALRSLAISQHALGTEEIAVLGHTGCGMNGFDDRAFRAELTASSGQAPDWDVPGFDDVAASVQQSVDQIRNCGWLPHTELVAGFVYDVRTGQITPVD